jgi:hypothetical protein
MSYYGWDGEESAYESSELFNALLALRYTGISIDLIIDLNDSGLAFGQIADYLS